MKQMLLLYFLLVLKKEKECDAVQFVHEALGISKSIITQAMDQFIAYDTVRTRDGSQRGRRNGPMQDAVNWLRRGWYGGQAVGGQEAKAPVNCQKLVEHSIKKVDEAIKRDDILSGSVEDGLENIPSSYKVSLDSGLEDLETGDEVQIL